MCRCLLLARFPVNQEPICTKLPVMNFVNEMAKISNEGNRPTTITQLGTVEGEWRASFEGRTYASLEGIPYAKPPIGDLRFSEPKPAEPWIGIWNATRIYKCPQTSLTAHAEPIGEEDCLYLNIYIPETEQSKHLDVVIHIHGGGYIAGYSNEYLGEKYVMDRDLILVTFNYRIGALGFLSTEDEVVPGNNGLRDQTLALQWVQDNIESFNGNPKSVTLTGFSAGASSVHFHYLSTFSKGLFHRGMSMSGSALNPWSLRLNPLKNAKRLAKSIGCDTDDTKQMVKCLKSRPASQIVEHTDALHGFGGQPFCLFPPVVDKQATRPFLPDLPENLLKAGKVLDIPWMVSFNQDDGIMGSIILKPLIDELNRRWDEIGAVVLQTDDAPLSLQQESLRKVKQYYATSGEDLTFEDLTKLETDALLKIGIEKSIQSHSAAVKSPVYFYKFGYSGRNSFKALITAEDIKGVCHGDDMVYFFGGMISKPLSDNDIRMKNVCLDVLYTYARNGKPRAIGTVWEPTSDELKYHLIDNPDRIEVKFKTDYSDNEFWKQIKILEKSYLLSYVKDEL